MISLKHENKITRVKKALIGKDERVQSIGIITSANPRGQHKSYRQNKPA
jgi:hypothetical protein